MTRAALYERVSTDDQAKEGFSLDAQDKRLRAYAEAQGWDVAAVYVDDGYSGRTARRPAYQAMLQAKDTWDVVVVLKMDRIHRNVRNFLDMMHTLGGHGKSFASTMESLDTGTAMGRFVANMMQSLAQLESEQTGERTHMGMKEKAEQNGGNLGKLAPYGYTYDHGAFVIVEAEHAWVRGAFERFAAGQGKKEISDWLNAGQQRGRGGAAWNVRTVSHLLTNAMAAGAIHWDGHVQYAHHEAIVDYDLFNRVQSRIQRDAPRRRVVVLQPT